MIKSIQISALAAASAGVLAVAAPAAAAPSFQSVPAASSFSGAGDAWQHSRDRRYYNGGYGYRQAPRQAYYGEPVYNSTRVWRGRDGRVYCRKRNGTTGLIIGAAGGALLGREIDGGRHRTTGTILGAAAGALLGREIARGGGRCR